MVVLASIAASALLTVAGFRLRTVCMCVRVVAHGPVASVSRVQRVAVAPGLREPGEELADLRLVGAARLVRQRSRPQRRHVLVEDPVGLG